MEGLWRQSARRAFKGSADIANNWVWLFGIPLAAFLYAYFGGQSENATTGSRILDSFINASCFFYKFKVRQEDPSFREYRELIQEAPALPWASSMNFMQLARQWSTSPQRPEVFVASTPRVRPTTRQRREARWRTLTAFASLGDTWRGPLLCRAGNSIQPSNHAMRELSRPCCHPIARQDQQQAGVAALLRSMLVEPVLLKPLRYEVGYLNVIPLEEHRVAVAEDTHFGQVDDFRISAVVVQRLRECPRGRKPLDPARHRIEVVAVDNQDRYLG